MVWNSGNQILPPTPRWLLLRVIVICFYRDFSQLIRQSLCSPLCVVTDVSVLLSLVSLWHDRDNLSICNAPSPKLKKGSCYIQCPASRFGGQGPRCPHPAVGGWRGMLAGVCTPPSHPGSAAAPFTRHSLPWLSVFWGGRWWRMIQLHGFGGGLADPRSSHSAVGCDVTPPFVMFGRDCTWCQLQPVPFYIWQNYFKFDDNFTFY